MKQRPQSSNQMQFLQLMQMAGKENNPRALKALKLIQMDENYFNSAFVQSVIKELTKTVSANAIMGDTLDPFRFELGMDVSGSLRLGQLINNLQIFGMFPSEFTMPTMIAGSTGSGKTNLIYVIASEIHRFNRTYGLKDDDRIGMFFFQTMKLDEDYLYNINDEIIFLDSDTLKINPLWHKGYNKELVFQHFIKLGGEIFFFREGSANQISQILEQKDNEFNGKPFSVYELFDGIKALPKTRYEGVLENRFAGLLSNKSACIFDCVKGLPFERLAHDFVIINLTDLDFYSQQFISIFIYQYLAEHFKDGK